MEVSKTVAAAILQAGCPFCYASNSINCLFSVIPSLKKTFQNFINVTHYTAKLATQ